MMGYGTGFVGELKVTPPLTHRDWTMFTNYHFATHGGSAPTQDCNWYPNEEGTGFLCQSGKNGSEQEYVLWLHYLVEQFLRPLGYVLNGVVEYQGERKTDRGKILVDDNDISVSSYQRDPDIPICDVCDLSYDVREPHIH